jgi:hypothetical protein
VVALNLSRSTIITCFIHLQTLQGYLQTKYTSSSIDIPAMMDNYIKS